MQNLEINAQKIIESERAQYLQLHVKSIALSQSAHQHFLYGVPMHWMNDWGTPTPLFINQASGCHFTCADGIDTPIFAWATRARCLGTVHQPS